LRNAKLRFRHGRVFTVNRDIMATLVDVRAEPRKYTTAQTTIVSSTKFRIHYNITITCNDVTSDSKWIGSVVIYKVMHRPTFIYFYYSATSLLETISRLYYTMRQSVTYNHRLICCLIYRLICCTFQPMVALINHLLTYLLI